MRRPTVALTLVLVWACFAASAATPAKPGLATLFGLPPPAPPPALVFTYHGWRIDARASASARPPEKTVRLTKVQLDMVERTKPPPEVLAVMRAVPIIIVAGTAPEAASYDRARGVVAYARRLDAGKPILLRGLLAAYYDRRMPLAQAAEIGRFRRQILAKRVWPKSADMLQNDRDYFAVTAAAYLHGAITREPYNRANLRKTQPDYYQWLARLFDQGRARR